MGRAPIKVEQQQEEEGDEEEEEEEVTIIDITPSRPIPAARKRSWGAEGPPGEGDRRLPPGGPPVTSPIQPRPTSDGCPRALVRRGLGPGTASVLCLQAGEHTGAPSSTPRNHSSGPWWVLQACHPSRAGSHSGCCDQSLGRAPGMWAWCQPHPGDSQACLWQVHWVPPSGPHHPKTSAPDTSSPILWSPSSPGSSHPGLVFVSPYMGTGSATPEALKERLLSEVPLERQSGRWHTRCTCPVVVWALTDSQFQEAHELLAAVGRWQVPAWDYVHNPDHPKRADKAKSMHFPCPQLGCPKVLIQVFGPQGALLVGTYRGKDRPTVRLPLGSLQQHFSLRRSPGHDPQHSVDWGGQGVLKTVALLQGLQVRFPLSPHPKENAVRVTFIRTGVRTWGGHRTRVPVLLYYCYFVYIKK